MNKKLPLPITAFIGGSVVQPPNVTTGLVSSGSLTQTNNSNNNNNNNNNNINLTPSLTTTTTTTTTAALTSASATATTGRVAASMCFSTPAKTEKKKSHDHHTASVSSSSNTSGLCGCHKAPKSHCISAIGVLLLVLVYTAMGSIIFMTLEGELEDGSSLETAVAASKPYPRTELANSEIRSRTVDRLWSITEDLNILYKENWTRLAAQEVQLFQDTLLRSVRQSKIYQLGGGIQLNPPTHKWTYASAFLYSLTLITTIGYGGVSPRTQWGRVAALVYALFGIPIVLLYLSAMGEGLSAGMRCLFRKTRSKNGSSTNNCSSSASSSSSTANSSTINGNNIGSNTTKKLHGDLNKLNALSDGKHYQHQHQHAHHHQHQHQHQHEQHQQHHHDIDDIKLNTLNSYGTLTKHSYNHQYHQNSNGLSMGINSSPSVPISICIMVMISYITAGSLLFHKMQNWTVLEALYFCFTSLGTIGFGELAPTGNLALYLAATYILIGMAIVAMCFNLIQTELMMWLRKFTVQDNMMAQTEDVSLVSVTTALPKSS